LRRPDLQANLIALTPLLTSRMLVPWVTVEVRSPGFDLVEVVSPRFDVPVSRVRVSLGVVGMIGAILEITQEVRP
jgi:hypothetical protein